MIERVFAEVGNGSPITSGERDETKNETQRVKVRKRSSGDILLRYDPSSYKVQRDTWLVFLGFD